LLLASDERSFPPEPELSALLAGRSIGPWHCQEPMVLAAGPTVADGGPGTPVLEWKCRCGLRVDAGVVPVPVGRLSAPLGVRL
jgi:hypothetical protein